MRHFNNLTDDERKKIFFIEPKYYKRDCKIDINSYLLGASLYIPAVKDNIFKSIIKLKNKDLMSVIICLEDAVGEQEIEYAKMNLYKNIEKLYLAIKEWGIELDDIPFIFIRVRYQKQMTEIVKILQKYMKLINGFVFPKFTAENGSEYFETLVEINKGLNRKLYAMPILETSEIIHLESRKRELENLRLLLKKYKDLVLNLRIGATDFSGLYGIRRNNNMTIYDIKVVADCIKDILNMFLRVENEYVISGVVWEYFAGENKLDKLNGKDIETLVKEIIMDKYNGFVGKTIIHPSHIRTVNSLYVVTYEEYLDAYSILDSVGKSGVIKSKFSNKMNEIKPHSSWAKRILKRADIYGVFNEEYDYRDLLRKGI